MMDRDSIARELAKDLDRKHVKPPPPGKYGEYIEGWHVIAEANRIFGWDGWVYAVSSLEQTNCDQRGDKWATGYMAVVKVTAWTDDTHPVSRQDVGHGQGHSKSLGDAHESAMKEAVTDALKRALRTFGHPMGLALYDKTKAHVSYDPNYDPEAEADRLLEALKHVADCDLAKWSKSNKDMLNKLKFTTYADYERVLAECRRRNEASQQEDAA